MDHVVYTDTKSNELQKIVDKSKTMIIRGATGRKLPYGRVNPGDILYFINNNGEGEVKAMAQVSKVYNSDKLSKEESQKLVQSNSVQLNLSEAQYNKWAGKRYLVLIEIDEVLEVTPFKIDKSNYANMDDWLPVEDVNKVKVQ